MSETGLSKLWLKIFLLSLAVVILIVGLLTLVDDEVQEGQEDKQLLTGKQELIIPEIAIKSINLDEQKTKQRSYNIGEQSFLLEIEENFDSEVELEPESEVAPSLVQTTLNLQGSDKAFRQDALAISTSKQFKKSLFQTEIIRKIIFSINDMAQGLRPSTKILNELPHTKAFIVMTRGDKMYISPKSYQRYDHLAQAIHDIDSNAGVAVYKKYLPLFRRVFKDFSYPASYQVSDIFKAAVGKVLQAPTIQDRIEVVQPSVHYKFADAKLENLSSLDKQMLRMGPDNTRVIQKKLRELISALIEAER